MRACQLDQPVKREVEYAPQDFTLAGNGIGQHHVKGRQAVAGHTQQALVIHGVKVAHLALVQKRQRRNGIIVQGKLLTSNGSRRMDHGKWVTANGSRQMGHGKWVTANGSRQRPAGTMAASHELYAPADAMKQSTVIAPSILSADFARLGEDVDAVIRAGADWVHFDVMDNHYVPNLTIGPMVCKSLRDYGIDAPIDVHLMIDPVDRIIPDFAAAGPSYISLHPQATRHVDRSLTPVREPGCRAGQAFNPATSLDVREWVIDKVDLVLIISVNPGFGGQAFIPAALDKIRQAREIIDRSGRSIRLEVDGGVKPDNAAAVREAGADTLVAGSAIFGADDYAATIRSLRGE